MLHWFRFLVPSQLGVNKETKPVNPLTHVMFDLVTYAPYISEKCVCAFIFLQETRLGTMRKITQAVNNNRKKKKTEDIFFRGPGKICFFAAHRRKWKLYYCKIFFLLVHQRFSQSISGILTLLYLFSGLKNNYIHRKISLNSST